MNKTIIVILNILLSFSILHADKKSEVRRFAIFAGANYGGPKRAKLRYAVTDAISTEKVFKEMGGLQSVDSKLLIEPKVKDLINELKKMEHIMKRLKDQYGRLEFIFYYSGHSDGEGLLLGKEKYKYKNLKDTIKKIPSDMNIVIVDSCASGALTRIKGGKKQPPFLVDSSMNMKGHAILTSSSADEVSQESDKIEGSFFTHYLVSGLRGAADTSQDGRVTLNEVYQYTYHETLARTEKTISGPQHPNYDIQMTGAGDVIMTDIKENSAGLILTKTMYGKYFIRDENRKLVAEINKLQGRSIEVGLGEGKYYIALEKDDKYYTGSIFLDDGTFMKLNDSKLKKQNREYAVNRGVQSYDKKQESHETEEGEYVHHPFIFSVIPEITVPMVDMSKKINNKAHFYLVYGRVANLDGFGIAIAADVVTEDVRGVQMGGAVNYVKGNFKGMQWAYGFNYARKIYGLQSGTVNVSLDVKGLQIATVNVTSNMNGAQIGVVNIAQEAKSISIGVVNISEKQKGTMIGVVNICGNLDGSAIGLVNIIGNGLYNFHVLGDETRTMNVEFQHGTSSFYNIYRFGINPFKDTVLSGLGFGIPFTLSKRITFAYEMTANSIHDLNALFKNSSRFLANARLAFDFKMINSFKLTAGLTYNFSTVFKREKIDPPPPEHQPEQGPKFSWNTEDSQHWPGFFVGMKF